MKVELASKKVSELKKRANAEGITADAIEEAGDGDSPKEALIKLIMDKVNAQIEEARPKIVDPESGDSASIGAAMELSSESEVFGLSRSTIRVLQLSHVQRSIRERLQDIMNTSKVQSNDSRMSLRLLRR